MALLSLVAKLGLNTTGFDQGLSKAGKQVAQFGNDLKSSLAGAFSVAAVTAFLRDVQQTMLRIKDLSEQFGVTTDEVQRVDYAMKQSGMAFEDFGAAMMKMGQARRDAVEGNEELRDTFAKYGISVADLNNPQKSNLDILMMLSKAMQGLNISGKEQVAIQDILGAKAGRLANVLASLSETKPPQMFSDADIKQVDEMTKAFERLYLQMQVVAAQSLTGAANQAAGRLESLFGSGKSLGDRLKAAFQTAVEAVDQAATGGTGRRIAGLLQKAKGEQPEANAANLGPAQAKQGAAAKGMWEIDKNKKTIESIASIAATAAALPALRQADQLGRIGAFSGGPSNNVNAQLKKSNDTLTAIQRVLEVRGIKIQEL